MHSSRVRGTEGYEAALQKFTEATHAIRFFDLHKDFVPFFPKERSLVLDIGAGIGRDAFVFSEMGHTVTAVEPAEQLREAGRNSYPDALVRWIDASLPALELPAGEPARFDFVLASGVWHHLDEEEQAAAMARVAMLLSPGGILALSLRHGPAGVGINTFSIDVQETIRRAEHGGLVTLLVRKNQPSQLKNKDQVSWTRLAFQNRAKSR